MSMPDSSKAHGDHVTPRLDIEATVRLLTKVGSCSGPSFAPDGERLAFISNLSGLPQAWVVPVAGGWPQPVTALDDPVSSVSWSPDGNWLALSVAPGGGMNGQIYLARPDGSELHRITAGGRDNNFLGPWTHDGKALAFGSNIRRAEAVDTFLYDIESGESRLVAENPGRGAISDLSRDGARAILSRVAHRSDSNLYLIDVESGRETLLTPHEGPGSFGNGRFAPDGRTIYLSSNRDRDLTAFARISLDAAGAPGTIEVVAARDGAELNGFDLTEDGQTAALLWNAAGRAVLTFVDLETMRETPGPELPGDIVMGLTFSHDGNLLALALAGATRPMDVWLLDRSHPSGRLSQMTHSPHVGVDLEALVRPELVRFPAHDDLELSAWLYRPWGAAGPGPIVLSFHGGPEGQERPRFDAVYQALLAQGIAVLGPNVRGSSGFGKRFVNLDNGALRWDGIKDIAACVDFVVKAGIADPKRIGIMGGSYGGYMTMAGLSLYPELFAAGANSYGVVNFATFFAHTEPWMAAISKIEYGDPDTEAEMLRELSPMSYIDRVTAPTLVLHGANDTNVPVVEAEQVVESLRERGVPVEYILFPDEGHGFRKLPNRIRAGVASATWFARYL